MMDMDNTSSRKDYRLLMKIKNNRILEMMEANGYSNVSQFCKAHDLSSTHVGQYINMKKRPVLKTGEWSVTVIRMANALRCAPESLFTEKQKETELQTHIAEVTFEERHLAQITNYTPEQKMIIDESSDNPLEAALESLTIREKNVIGLRFGLGGDREKTLQEVSDIFGVTRERIRQIEGKALRKLRNPSRGLRDSLFELLEERHAADVDSGIEVTNLIDADYLAEVEVARKEYVDSLPRTKFHQRGGPKKKPAPAKLKPDSRKFSPPTDSEKKRIVTDSEYEVFRRTHPNGTSQDLVQFIRDLDRQKP